MKKIMILSVLALAVSVGFQSTAFSAEAVKKYAVVDVKKVVNSSSSVKTLKAERAKQKEAVLNFVKDGNAKVAAEKDPKKKEELKKKLNNDLKYMTKSYDQKYKDGLKKINDEINADINKVAKEKKYELILTTDAVLYGGDNITNEIIKAVK
ncbi:MAG: OmpH family outer membrane protein [Clostridium sp.]|nr:OmpH family outer membrane protein [Clostridium sp.]